MRLLALMENVTYVHCIYLHVCFCAGNVLFSEQCLQSWSQPINSLSPLDCYHTLGGEVSGRLTVFMFAALFSKNTQILNLAAESKWLHDLSSYHVRFHHLMFLHAPETMVLVQHCVLFVG